MSAFVLKLIAAASMLTDHAGVILLYTRHTSASLYLVMRSLGRIAFPIYSLLLVIGFEHTKSRRAYLERLMLFSVISQLPYSLALAKGNYSLSEYPSAFSPITDMSFILPLAAAAVIFLIFYQNRENCRFALITGAAFLLTGFTATVKGVTVWGDQLNVMYTLAASLALLWLFELWRERRMTLKELLPLSILTLGLCSSVLLRSDYGFNGFILIAAIYFCRSYKSAVCLVMAAWCLYKYFPTNTEMLYILPGALAALVPTALYSGKQGRKTRLFYLVYPVHLTLYALVGLFVL